MSNRADRCNSEPWRRLRRWWAQQLPLPCGRCGQPVLPGDKWDLDHMTPRSQGGTDDTARPSHAYCNRKAGQELTPPRPPRDRYYPLEERAVVGSSRKW